MYSFYIYLETLVFMTFFILFKTCQNFLRVVGDNAEWYASRRIHWWQFSKANRSIDEEFGRPFKKIKKPNEETKP